MKLGKAWEHGDAVRRHSLPGAEEGSQTMGQFPDSFPEKEVRI